MIWNCVSFWPVVLGIWSSAVKSWNFESQNWFIFQAHNWNVHKTVECLKTTFKFMKYFVDFFFFNSVIWSQKIFVCIFTLANSVYLWVCCECISMFFYTLYIWIYSVYLTCHLTSWFAIYTGLGTFLFYFKALPPDLHVLYWCTVWQ